MVVVFCSGDDGFGVDVRTISEKSDRSHETHVVWIGLRESESKVRG